MMARYPVPPRRSRLNVSTQLGVCFLATMVIMALLILVTFAFGQDHPFPFKTLDELSAGTPAWQSDSPMEIRMCPGTETLVGKKQYRSGAGSVWIIYTDAKVFAAAYFPPGVDSPPASVVEGKIADDGKVIVLFNDPYNPTLHRPCNPWTQKSAHGG